MPLWYLELRVGIKFIETCAASCEPHAELDPNSVAHSTSTADLPSVLTEVMQPWVDVIESAVVGMGQDVMKVAAEAVISLQRRVVMTSDLESIIANARLASDNLGISLDQDDSDPSKLRSEALTALKALILPLHEARPNERAKGLGLGW